MVISLGALSRHKTVAGYRPIYRLDLFQGYLFIYTTRQSSAMVLNSFVENNRFTKR